VRHPVLAGGRSPAEQALLVPFGDAQIPQLQADRPWPGNIPAPAPATVYPMPRPARVTDSSGALVTVTGRGQVSASPATLSMADESPLAITAWTGPWPVTQRWWDPGHACRKARFQLVTVDGSAWLAVVLDGRWLIEAGYD
jgi:protein ImuB